MKRVIPITLAIGLLIGLVPRLYAQNNPARYAFVNSANGQIQYFANLNDCQSIAAQVVANSVGSKNSGCWDMANPTFATPTISPTASPTATKTGTPTPTPSPSNTATATATPTPVAAAYNIADHDSVLAVCNSQTTGNADSIAMNLGDSAGIGCGTSATAVSRNLATQTTVMLRCDGGNPNGNQHSNMQTTGQVVTYRCAPGVTPTPTPSQTATPVPTGSSTPIVVPSGVPIPPAIPPIPSLNNPVTVRPGAVFGGNTVKGDGSSDDTAAIQAALNTSDIIVTPATYAISGNVTIPTGRNISCQSGAAFLDTQSLGTRMFGIGYGSNSVGNNSIVGCIIEGTDSVPGNPASYANYKGGTSVYSETLEIASGNGIHTDHVLIENDTFQNTQGDALLTYSPCGTKNTGPCNGGAPGTEGPSNIWIVNDSVSHCGQPGIHLNGGQNLVVTGLHSIDCADDDEVDANVLQVIKSWWYGNFFGTQYGAFDPLNGNTYGPEHSCTGDNLLPANDSNCWSFNNTVDGRTSFGPSELWEMFDCGPAAGQGGQGGHYINETATNGALIRPSC